MGCLYDRGATPKFLGSQLGAPASIASAAFSSDESGDAATWLVIPQLQELLISTCVAGEEECKHLVAWFEGLQHHLLLSPTTLALAAMTY